MRRLPLSVAVLSTAAFAAASAAAGPPGGTATEVALERSSTTAAAGSAATSRPAVRLTGRIAFVSERDGDDEIMMVPAGGGPVTQLTDDDGPDRAPQWSPDGTRLVFNSRREPHADQPEIYLLDVRSGALDRLTDSPLEDQRASFAPTGRAIYFQRGTFLTGFAIHKLWLRTKVAWPVAQPSSAAIFDAAPDAHPGNGRLILQTNRGSAGLFPFRLAFLRHGTGAVETVETGVADSVDGPRWSPDGRRIVFAAGGDIYLHVPGRRTARAVTTGDAYDLSPDWSPDGRSLVFQSDRVVEDGGLHILDLETGRIRFVGEGRTPVWGPAPG